MSNLIWMLLCYGWTFSLLGLLTVCVVGGAFIKDADRKEKGKADERLSKKGKD